MGFIVNSSALIAAERRRITYQQVLPSASEPVAIAAITASELLHGLQRSPPAHRQAREPILEQLLSAWPISHSTWIPLVFTRLWQRNSPPPEPPWVRMT